MNSFFRDSTIVFRRQIRMNLRNPAWVLIGVMQPILYLLLFGPLLKPLVAQFPRRRGQPVHLPGAGTSRAAGTVRGGVVRRLQPDRRMA